MRTKHTFRLPPDLAGQLADYADRKRVYARRIEVGLPIGGEVEIRSGLNGEEQIVVAGQQKLREGTAVQIVGGVR